MMHRQLRAVHNGTTCSLRPPCNSPPQGTDSDLRAVGPPLRVRVGWCSACDQATIRDRRRSVRGMARRQSHLREARWKLVRVACRREAVDRGWMQGVGLLVGGPWYGRVRSRVASRDPLPKLRAASPMHGLLDSPLRRISFHSPAMRRRGGCPGESLEYISSLRFLPPCYTYQDPLAHTILSPLPFPFGSSSAMSTYMIRCHLHCYSSY